jgi:single-strand selective monofunctional uracil DNA glycosylase
MTLTQITDLLLQDLRPLRFGPPVTHVYNPLEYARNPYNTYLKRFAKKPKEILLLGMNPGPWGMAQTGIPFGEVCLVKEWLKIEGNVDKPVKMHPRKPVQGFECPRSEVSGRRLWGWAQETFHRPERFFQRFLVINYCPLLFIEETGRNRTPDQLPSKEREPLFEACDRALLRTVRTLALRYVIGVGRFAEKRARSALTGLNVEVGGITHPSPANPKANQGWAALIEKELSDLGIQL